MADVRVPQQDQVRGQLHGQPVLLRARVLRPRQRRGHHGQQHHGGGQLLQLQHGRHETGDDIL